MSDSRLPSEQRRRQLLDVALETFATHGYHDASMESVAKSAGVTKPVLYQHFDSKRDLYLCVLADVGSKLEAHIAKTAAAASSPREQVDAGFSAFFHFVRDHQSAMTVLIASQHHSDLDLAETAATIESEMASIVEGLIEADVDADQRQLLAHSIVGLATGSAGHWIARGLDLDPDKVAKQVSNLAWSGLRGVYRIQQ